MDSDDEIY